MDDGTVACIGKDHYVITTTTAAAGQVMTHLEFVSQCLTPKMDVTLMSVTEQWAQFAVAGPRSKDLINFLVEEEESLNFQLYPNYILIYLTRIFLRLTMRQLM